MNALGVNRGTTGNVSARIPGGFLVTPTGMPYEALAPGDIVAVADDGRVAEGDRLPSSEWRLHRDVFASRPEAGAVVHTHAVCATALACLGRDIPSFHYMVAVAGGDSIRCAPYATFGTQALSDRALEALDGRRACLLANHGMVAIGETLEAALALAVNVETLAEQYWRALAIGEPKLLSRAEMGRVGERFRSYGRQPDRRARPRPGGGARARRRAPRGGR